MKLALRFGFVLALGWAASQNATAELVGYWPFNGTGDEATGNNIDLTLVGNAGYGTSVAPGLGNALSMSIDEEGLGGGAIGADFVKFTTVDVTVVAWAFAESLDGDWNSIVKNWGDGSGGQFHLGLGNVAANTLQNHILTGNVTASTDFPVGEWVHTAFVLDSTTFEHRLYLNGEVVATGAYLDPLGPGDATGLGVGVKPNDAGSDVTADLSAAGYWNGRLDDVGLYNEALSTEQIMQIYQDGLAGIQLDGTSIEPPPTQPGDFDGDGDVDGADFVVWQTNFPTQTGATLATGDADGDGDVDGADFVIWQTNFPFTPSSGVATVPEPAAWLLAIFFLAGLTPRFRRVSVVAAAG